MQSDIKEQLLGEMSRHNLQADRKTVDESSRDRNCGVAMQVGGESQSTVVACSGTNPTKRRWKRTFGVKCNIWVGRGENKINTS
jgi:hypothetical protein